MRMTICLMITVVAFGACTDRTINTNTSPDKTSLPGTPTPGNATVSNTNAMNSNMSGTMQDSFWTKAAIGGMAEVELGKLASAKSQNADVKRFAQMMVTDHSKANDELKAIATKKNVTLPTALDSTHQSILQRLQGLSGADFDRAYVDEMVEDHEMDVQEFEEQSQKATDADAKAFAAKTLPTLRKHLDAIKSIEAKMK